MPVDQSSNAQLPEWLYLLRTGLLAVTAIVTLAYPNLTSPEARERHANALEKFMHELRNLRTKFSAIINRTSIFSKYILDSLYGDDFRIVFVSFGLSLFYLSAIFLVNYGWLSELSAYRSEKAAIDFKVDYHNKYTQD